MRPRDGGREQIRQGHSAYDSQTLPAQSGQVDRHHNLLNIIYRQIR